MGAHCYFSIVVLWGCVLYLSSFHGVLSTYFDVRDLANSSYTLAQSSNTCASNILYLREENDRLQQELDHFKHKNTALQLHINSLSGQCGSVKRCQSEGIFYADGDVWYPDPCTTCRCEIDSINCYTSFHSPYCEFQCNENTCLNGGVCMGSLGDHSVQCSCPDGFSGPLCEQSVTSCVPIQTDDHCNHTQPLWYFDSYSNQCKSTVSGCFEFSSIFPTFEACSLSCLQGTCCYRMKIGEISDMICQAETMKNCQVLCQDENIEVLGFYPGIKCPNEGCAMIASKVCHTGISLYSPGSKFSFGCDSCECFDEHIFCSCQTVNIRHEIRELSYSERIQYQEAISLLQIGRDNSVWTSLRNLYVTHIMHANSPQYFLFWNRNFLRTMERHLQELNCSITIPYFDFTLDAGNLASSVVWRSDFFGSLTENGSYCQRHTISKSGIPWTPCIKRAVRSNNNAPTMVDVALALSKTDFFEFTSMLHGIANYIHGFIGGDMATTSSPHDPIFYSLHAYIDLLFWQWERRYSNQKYKNEILNANLVPFNVKQKFLVNSERNLCVSYATSGESDKDRDQYGTTNIYDTDFSECFTDAVNSFSESPCDAKMKAIVNTGHRIQSVLYNQEENFLKTLPRTCLSSQDFPETSMNHMWDVQPDHFEIQSNFQPIDIKSEWCEQFCFTADIFLPPKLSDTSESLCSSSNQVEIPICEESALLKCPYYTYAPCRLSLCGNCTLICHINNEDIECKDPKIDFCSPNPCKNGGICMPSEWPSLPYLVSCDCRPGFEGQRCEQESTQRCSLPQDSGKLINTCGTPQKRWYFDAQKQECFSFMYQGCSGNANNFPSYYECRTSCIIGACCSRRPQHMGRTPGFNSAGYDRYGFTAEGKSLKNQMRMLENGYGGDKGIYRYQNFDYQGYNKNGFTNNGIDRYGYDKNGYHHVTMFNLTGYNNFGAHNGDIEFDEFGYNKEGYNRVGLNCSGRSKDGWDYYELSSGWSYECRVMSLKDCQNIEKEPATPLQKVVAFSPGKKCEEFFCDEQCGCSFFKKSLSVGTKFGLGCGTCECTTSGRVSCPCTTMSIRKEVRDMTSEEWKRYQDAIKVLAMTSAWQNLTVIYREFVPQSHGNQFFLPWHRFFVRYSEMKLQEIDCSVTIPYFDWTLDVGQLETSVVWQANMFGGNGDKTRNNCVMKHPFKNYFPSYWNCLRRDFNSSVFLPNAIDLEKILRIQTFEEFSLQIDTISGLFHLFVGGNMASGDSSYDPIFFSHYAFIDKIWNDWITVNPNNIQKFPQTIRYVPLVPFSIVSDDVLLSEIQLCVNYKDITEGAPCVDGSKYSSINFNTADVQSKGFDASGYDIEGYDSFGYDQMGWRKDGIFRDSYNRDGFDVNGYDRKGFNRYGFDRIGCNSKGICMSESLLKLNGNMSNLPWFEFDQFGFSSSGFDFHGYDAYGFDANGFDRNNCSYFFNGPFYPIFMKNARMQMKTLSHNELNNIGRTCDFVPNLPKWWLNLYWLNRNSRYNLHLAQPEGHLYSPFAGSKDLWIPPVPEERFCFQLHYYSKCELNKPPVPCPFSTCDSKLCPTLPSAQCRDFGCGSCDRNFFNVISQKAIPCNTNDCISVDGNVKSNGEEWEEESCYTCSCQAGFVSCSSVNCDTACDHPVVVPGTCCPVCDGCMKDTILYSNEESFIDPQNPCLNCTCKRGSILSTTVECAPMKPCMKSALVTLHGECCPTCSMCGPHTEGSYWMESPCHNCTCDTGNVNCKVIECAMPDCQYPARNNGECCRHCNDCEYRGSYVKNEEIFNLENCVECKCQKGNISCQKIDCSHSICKETGYEFNPCCNTCRKGCQYDGKDYEDGNLFNPSFNPCLNCSCGKGLVRCQPVKCPEPEDTCEIPVFPPGGCCPVCPKCTFYGRVYTNGKRWKISNESCETCVCLNGIASCSEKESCPNQKCTHGVVPAGECCSPCIDCKYNDHVVPDNMQFSPPDDSCSRCICQKGNITCVREACPRLLCQATELPPGACCPVCKGCFNSLGQPVQHGHKWVHHSDICQVCTCENSITKCERIVCKIPCTHPIKRPDVCCPECNGCLVSGSVYQNNAEIPTSDPCRRCYCYNGNMDCQSVSCPQMTCANPRKEPESCCYICEECNFQGHTYKNGTKFQPSSEPCYSCTCDKGAVYCERRDHHCNPQCTDPVKIPGQCCPICDGCEYEGSILKNKERFTPNPEEPCLQCECNNGNVRCFQRTCPKLSCLNPVRPEKQCCEECLQYCVDESRKEKIYQEGEVWMSLKNECDVCTCKDSIVQCERMQCPATHCQHPAAPFGVCCPECDHCEFTHRLYRNGQEFTHEDDPCQICKCENGSVSCQTIICDPLPCMHPEELKGLCCPICSPEVKCHQAGKTYDAWENFLDPRNSCSECVCVDGMSSCHPVLCLNPECPNPQFGHCCDSCDGCSYGEKNYINHVTFHDPQNQCRDCQCESGVVSCQQAYCPPTDCENPIYMEGNCCPVCRDCKYKGSFYRDGESFTDPENDCSECYCQYPEVYCQRSSCSEASCIEELTTRCRDGIAADCYFFDETHESGTVFTHPDNPCEICSCQNRMVTCFEQHCPSVRCTYPVHMNCCTVCSEGCMINGTLYKEGQPIQDSPNSCQECVCQNGNMTCKPKQCPPVNCKKPSTDGCCPVCKDCIYNNENIKNGQEVVSPEACQTCLCVNGNIECKSKSCEVIHCAHPIVKDCCPSCDFGCLFNGKTYKSGEEMTNPEKPCESCKCEKGSMKCVLKQCLKTDCLNPVMKDCCPICDLGCIVEGQFYEINANIDYHNRPCDLCTCLAVTVVCTPKPCDSTHCSHPIMKNCCPVCDSGCMSEGQFYELNAQIDYHNRPCEVCTCLAGSIVCNPKPCESAHCSHPIMKNCCPVCDSGCLYDRKVFADRETFKDPANPCETCTCTNGNIECKPKTCDTVYCLNPVVEDCCPVCDLGCLYQETVYHFGAEFDDPTDPCSECACMEGSILCDRKPCDPVDCENVITDDQTCCPYCPDHCKYNGKRKELDAHFPHETDPCQECVCLNGDVHCERKICPSNKCLHPAPGRCCLECLNCRFHEEIYKHNTNFTNTEDACETCLCSKGQVICERNSCIQCIHPILNDFNCCPLCDGCFYGGMNITNQQRFISPENPCDECICKSGTVTCHKLSCSLPSCANPVVPPRVCCPVCPGCIVSGTHFDENEDFAHPDDVCNKCICKDGHIACKRQICEKNCTHPIPDPCCPICNGCMFERINYVNNERFNPDSCRSCECKEGNVKCTSEICPKLNCQLKVRLPGQCCETCRGCVYEGNEYENNATWVPSSNPCLSCKCIGGSVSCTNIVCPVECVEPVPVSGFCCPICPDCEQDGIKYKSGQRFSPPSRPCDTCTCDSGHVFCIRHECPVLIDCPEESVKPPGIGECCPTCAAFGSSCTRDQIGHLYHPYPDPCFACQCSENFMWICSKEFCPPLNCPPEELIRNDKECCPKCKVCITEGLEHLHGDLWFMPNDPCNQCFCDFGFIKCSRITCPTISCEAGMTEFRFPGECCAVCTSSTELSCDYGRAFYKNGQSWKPDPCTTCLCTQGKMHCQNERCIPLDCTSDEIPSVDPGQCCPKCIPRPATCLAFGDPHYRTFDGASISFQGTCRYVLTADCSTQKFSIMVENNDRGFNGVSWTHRVVVVLQNASVDLRAGPTVYVRGKFIENLPYFENPILYVEKTGPSVLVTTDVGVQVLWNGDGYVEVTVSGVYRGKTCGLCGNFNNFPEDDMRTPSNQTVTSEAKFGNSWKYGDVQPSGCTESVDIDPCSKGGYRIRKIANTKCSILKQTLFAPCHRLIPPEPFFAACVYDVCACSENDDCLCDILSTYSQECSKAGVILNWRSEGLCGIHCSEIEGLVFDECGPPCQRTCENINLPMGILASQCFKPCVPGCQCSADKVLHNGRCIRPELCP